MMKKTLEASLPDSQEILSAAYYNSPFAQILSRVLDGMIFNVNEAFLEIYGMKAGDVIGKTSLSLNLYANPDDRDKLLKILKREGRVRNYELNIRRSTGEEIPVLLSLELICSDGSNYMLTTIQDISGLKKIERELRESEELFRNLFENHASIMMLVEEDTGQILDANLAAVKFYGYSRDTLRTMNISQINQLPVHEVQSERKKILEEEKDYFQFPHKLSSGEIKWVEVHSSPIYYQGKTILFSVINDISHQKRIASELIRSELRFRSTFENAAVGMAVVDRAYRWIQVNTKLCSITGYTAEELQNMHVSDITHPDDREVGIRELDTLWQTGNVLYNREKRYIRKDGTVIWVRVTVSPQMDTDGTIRNLISVIEEITEQKRTARQIEQVNRELKSAHDFMENVIHIAMHDLRSPVANLHLCIQAIEAQTSEEGKERYFRLMKEFVDKLLTTLTDLTGLLEFLSKKKINSDEIDVAELVESVIQENDHIIGNGSIQYKTDIGEIRYVRPFLESLLRNLVTNAIKYADGSRDLMVDITIKREGEFIALSVRDNGIGIDTVKYGAHLFQPFRRFTTKASGTGIGLYLVKSIVERNGGYVKLESKPAEGTTIHCFLKEYEN